MASPILSRTLRALARGLDHVEECLIATLIAAATLLIFVAVLHRASARVPALWDVTGRFDLTWAQELCIVLFIWMAKFGAAYGVRTGVHIGVDLLANALPPARRRWLIASGLALGALFTGVIAWLGARWVGFMHETGQVTADLEWPRWVVYLCIPLGSGLMCLRFVQTLVAYLRGGALPGHGPPDAVLDDEDAAPAAATAR
jgi:C4-dicarboxylate transporter DctQ subunit